MTAVSPVSPGPSGPSAPLGELARVGNIVARPVGVALGFDTSENLTRAHYAFMRAQLGMKFGARYAPLSGQSPTSPGVLQPSELADAFAEGFGMMCVQFSRTGGWSISTGLADGEELARHMLERLKLPNVVSAWADIFTIPSAQQTEDYCNALYEGTIKGGLASSANGNYFEPGVPLTSEQRYTKINAHRYWSTAAGDPNRMVAHRGCQLIQLWGSSRGEFFPMPGLVIDGDASQQDYFGDFAVAAYAA